MKKILYHTNSAHTFFSFRLPLMRAMADAGYEVVACGPRDAYGDAIEAAGIRFIDLPMQLSTINPLSESLIVARLAAIYRRERPWVVHHFSLKPIAYGSLAARVARVPIVINTVTGLGHAFAGTGLLRTATTALLRVACSGRTWTTFQNPENRELFCRLRIAVAERTALINGSGVDVNHFRPPAEKRDMHPMTFLLVSRMLWSKGVREYCEAAARLTDEANRHELPRARFILMGGALPGNPTGVAAEWLANPDAIPAEWLEARSREPHVEYRPHDDNVLPHLQEADVAVLPSYYPEGLPRSLLEAMSCGRAILTTDMPGCREVVTPGVNGLMIAPRDVGQLCAAMRTMLRDSDMVRRMGAASRQMVLESYADDVIIDEYREVYRRAGLGMDYSAQPVSA